MRHVLGYLGGVAIAVVVFDLAARVWQGGGPVFPRVIGLDYPLARILLFTPVGWIAALVPFLAVHWSTGRRAFADPTRSVLSGVIVILLAFPIQLWLVRALLVNMPPYAQQLAEVFRLHWLPLIVAGGAFGLAYWAIERRLSLGRSKPD